jgi:hypothetical protein
MRGLILFLLLSSTAFGQLSYTHTEWAISESHQVQQVFGSPILPPKPPVVTIMSSNSWVPDSGNGIIQRIERTPGNYECAIDGFTDTPSYVLSGRFIAFDPMFRTHIQTIPVNKRISATSYNCVDLDRVNFQDKSYWDVKKCIWVRGKIVNNGNSWRKVKITWDCFFDIDQDFFSLTEHGRWMRLGFAYSTAQVTGTYHVTPDWLDQTRFIQGGHRHNQFGSMPEDGPALSGYDPQDPVSMTKAAIVFLSPGETMTYSAFIGSDNGITPDWTYLDGKREASSATLEHLFRCDISNTEVDDLGVVSFPQQVPEQYKNSSGVKGSILTPVNNTTEP